MFRSIRWLLVMSLLLSPVLLAAAGGAGSRTMDYAWLLFLRVNEPPLVDAGENQGVATNSVQLNATATDDGPGDMLTYEWSGPEGVIFDPPDAADTVATFPSSGTFTLQFTASDGELMSSDQVVITVTNRAPTSEAGIDRTIIEPDYAVFLDDAEVSDDFDNALEFQWTVDDGKTGVRFGNQSGSSTDGSSPRVTTTVDLTGADFDTYVLRLTVTDWEGLSDSDTVTIEYLPKPVDKIEVVRAIGDSITEGIGDGDGNGISSCKYDSDSGKYILNSCAGYTPKLQSLINNRGDYANGVQIHENGYPGETSADGLSRIRNIVQWTPKAEQYLVLFGTNDSCGSSAESPAGFKSNMRKIVEAIQAEGAEPVLAKVPYAKGGCYSDYLIREYNKAINALVSEKSLKVVPLDFYGWYCGHQGEIWTTRIDQKATYENGGVPIYKDDNVHPKEKDSVHGYRSMAERWRDCLLGGSACKYYVENYKSTCDML